MVTNTAILLACCFIIIYNRSSIVIGYNKKGFVRKKKFLE